MSGVDGCLHRSQGVSVMQNARVRRALVAAFASVVTVVIAVPATAYAQTYDVGASATVSSPVGSVRAAATVTATSTPNPNDGLDQAFAGSPGLLLQQILCPLATAVGGVTTSLPGVGPILDQLPGIVCAIGVVGYVYRSTYLPPTGPPVVRYTRALAGVPTPIDVDGVGLPDFAGTITI